MMLAVAPMIKKFAAATLARLLNGHPHDEPCPSHYGLDPFLADSVRIHVHRQFEALVLAKARALAQRSTREDLQRPDGFGSLSGSLGPCLDLDDIGLGRHFADPDSFGC